ncbi:protein quiver [Trichonephila clavata]|uniref:UPAR/Ly6 domain-containing protein qvr n=1 Tax=Trichonephila clavata TaxID=2740835 RepID=A0A8X6KNZ1_TRICU|nr:protein quiver [Trichonephila clavata]
MPDRNGNRDRFRKVLFAAFWCLNAEEECMKSTYWCYECDTWNDYRCKDPFNSSAHPNDLPPLKQCEGCCVKIVMYAGTSKEVIRRTCTKKLQINLFMVDHVCMYEGGNTGHMCFCERDNCNGVPQIAVGNWALTTCAFLGVVFLNIRQIFRIF